MGRKTNDDFGGFDHRRMSNRAGIVNLVTLESALDAPYRMQDILLVETLILESNISLCRVDSWLSNASLRLGSTRNQRTRWLLQRDRFVR